METVQSVKQRFELIGNDPTFNRAIEKALQVAPTDISVLVTGESGVGKESIPRIIHSQSFRKHAKYIAVNCGAIPEGTIDSELFGHEKGAFTGATQTRSGYFEVADGGTIFLDEVGELPLPTQVRLLRVLENGEFLKVGSSQTQKTDVRIVAATNVNLFNAIEKGKFREDLYYRLSTVEIELPPLRARKEDIHLLFRKFASDFAGKYKMPTLKLDDQAIQVLVNYRWSGNIRQLRNIAEQISVLEKERNITAATLKHYLPDAGTNLPAVVGGKKKSDSEFANEREILYKVLFDMKNDLNDLKKLTNELMNSGSNGEVQEKQQGLINRIYGNENESDTSENGSYAYEDVIDQAYEVSQEDPYEKQAEAASKATKPEPTADRYDFAQEVEEEESLSLVDKEIELIKKSLERHEGKRKAAADDLGISERTLYRKIKQYDL